MRNVVRLLGGLAVAIAMASPAAADWKTEDYPGMGSQAVAAAEGDGRAQFQIACSADAPGLVVVTIFFGERYDRGANYSNKVPISVTTDDRKQPTVYGSFENYGGVLVVVSDTRVSNTLAQVFGPMRASKSTIKVQFDQREYRFSPKGLTAAMRHLYEECNG
jgi:hypothetical protein